MKQTIEKDMLSPLTPREIDSLTAIVPETIFLKNVNTPAKAFTSADLWNIQRRLRSRVARKFM